MFRMIVLIVTALSLLWWLLADWLVRKHLPGKRWPRVLVAVFAIFHIGYLVFRIVGRMRDWDVEPPLLVEVSGYVWHLVVVPLVVVPMLLVASVVGLLRLARWISNRYADREPAPEAPVASEPGEFRLSRRQFIGLSVAVAPPLLTFTGTAIALPQLDHLRMRELDAPIRGLPIALDGLRIAHISDIHAGKFTGPKVLEKMIEQTMAASPDLILVTGDILDSSHDYIPAAVEALKKLNAPHGVFLCEGNHDLFGGVQEFRDGIRACGHPLLLNQWERISIDAQSLDVGGVSWAASLGNRRLNLEGNLDELFSRRPDGGGPASLLLAHHPHAFDRAVLEGIGATFAGHTHGGQIMLTGDIGPGPMMFKYWSGLYQRIGRSLVVSNGIGNWMPLRINAPAELVMVTLRGA